MNKTELVKSIAKKSGLTIAQSQSALDAVTETIVETLEAGLYRDWETDRKSVV